ncbi:MAG: hypothetical protein ACK5OQ_16270 [Burkholderiales bacterium]|jgi:predicted alpha/beta-hydrolase family hydrolase
MAKVVPDAFIDGGLTLDTALNQVLVCAGQPTSYADAATRALATSSMSAPTLGAGSPDGRQSNLPAVNNITISTSGTADHICYRDTVNSLYIVTTCTSTALVANGSNTVSVGATTRRIGAAI